MKVLLNGKEIKTQSFAELKFGDVFAIVGGGAYIKTNQGHMCSLTSGAIEGYQNQQLMMYPEAVLILDPECCAKKKYCHEEKHCKETEE